MSERKSSTLVMTMFTDDQLFVEFHHIVNSSYYSSRHPVIPHPTLHLHPWTKWSVEVSALTNYITSVEVFNTFHWRLEGDGTRTRVAKSHEMHLAYGREDFLGFITSSTELHCDPTQNNLLVDVVGILLWVPRAACKVAMSLKWHFSMQHWPPMSFGDRFKVLTPKKYTFPVHIKSSLFSRFLNEKIVYNHYILPRWNHYLCTWG